MSGMIRFEFKAEKKTYRNLFRIIKDKNQLESNLKALTGRCDELGKRVDDLTKSRDEKSKPLTDLEQAREELKNNKNQQLLLIKEAKDLEKDLNSPDLKDSLKKIYEEDLSACREKTNMLENKALLLKETIGLLEKQLPNVVEEITNIDNELKGKIQQLDKSEEDKKKTEASLKEKQKRLFAAIDKFFPLQALYLINTRLISPCRSLFCEISGNKVEIINENLAEDMAENKPILFRVSARINKIAYLKSEATTVESESEAVTTAAIATDPKTHEKQVDLKVTMIFECSQTACTLKDYGVSNNDASLAVDDVDLIKSWLDYGFNLGQEINEDQLKIVIKNFGNLPADEWSIERYVMLLAAQLVDHGTSSVVDKMKEILKELKIQFNEKKIKQIRLDYLRKQIDSKELNFDNVRAELEWFVKDDMNNRQAIELYKEALTKKFKPSDIRRTSIVDESASGEKRIMAIVPSPTVKFLKSLETKPGMPRPLVDVIKEFKLDSVSELLKSSFSRLPNTIDDCKFSLGSLKELYASIFDKTDATYQQKVREKFIAYNSAIFKKWANLSENIEEDRELNAAIDTSEFIDDKNKFKNDLLKSKFQNQVNIYEAEVTQLIFNINSFRSTYFDTLNKALENINLSINKADYFLSIDANNRKISAKREELEKLKEKITELQKLLAYDLDSFLSSKLLILNSLDPRGAEDGKARYLQNLNDFLKPYWEFYKNQNHDINAALQHIGGECSSKHSEIIRQFNAKINEAKCSQEPADAVVAEDAVVVDKSSPVFGRPLEAKPKESKHNLSSNQESLPEQSNKKKWIVIGGALVLGLASLAFGFAPGVVGAVGIIKTAAAVTVVKAAGAVTIAGAIAAGAIVKKRSNLLDGKKEEVAEAGPDEEKDDAMTTKIK